MRNLTMLFLLALASADALAQWSEVGKTPEALVYIDRASIERQGGVARMVDIFDFTAAQQVEGKSYLSLQSLAEYDCIERRTRPLRIIAFSKNMGEGSVASSLETPGPWEHVAPASMEQELWRLACSRG